MQSSIEATIISIGAFTSRQASSNPTSQFETSPPAASRTPAPTTSSSTSTSQSRNRPSPASSRATSGSICSTPAVSAPEPPCVRQRAWWSLANSFRPRAMSSSPSANRTRPPRAASPRCRCRARWRKCAALRGKPFLVRQPGQLEHRQRHRTSPAQSGSPAAGPGLAQEVGPPGALADPLELDDGRARMRRGQSGGRELDRFALCPGTASGSTPSDASEASRR